MPELSFVSPVYRCRDCLEKLVEEIAAVCERINVTYEVILVNDGCPENSWEEILRIARANPLVKGVKLSRNFGQHSAIEAGLNAASGEWVIVLDCDLQDHPSTAEELWRVAKEGSDVVLVRRISRSDGIVRAALSTAFYKTLSFLTGTKLSPEIANFGIYHRRVIEAYISWKEEQKYFPVMIQWLGFAQKTIDAPQSPRFAGTSAYNFRSLLKLGAQIVLSFSDRPLWIMAFAGAFVAGVALLASFVYFVRALLGETDVMGWTSLILSIWFLGGVNVLVGGLLGIYLGRALREAKGRPSFIVSGTVNLERRS